MVALTQSKLLVSFFVLLSTAVASCRPGLACTSEDLKKFEAGITPNSYVHRQIIDNNLIPRNLSSLVDEANKKPLSVAEKRTIIATISRFMSQVNPHRFLQLNFLKFDVVQELAAFSDLLDTPSFANHTNVEFHEQMMDTFQRMNDKHTIYIKPEPLVSTVGTLAFRVTDFFVDGDVTKTGEPRRRYVAIVPEGVTFENEKFATGSEILAWDGEDIDKVVRKLGEESSGSNTAAQISNGILLLSIRLLGLEPIPFSPAVQVTFQNTDGVVEKMSVAWRFFQVNNEEIVEVASRRSNPVFLGFDVRKGEQTHSIPNWRHPNVGEFIPGFRTVRASTAGRKVVDVDEEFVPLFSAEIITTQTGDIGRLILHSFNSMVTPELISELSRVLRLMPTNGLVIDIRNNPGGHPEYTKALLELISEKKVECQPMSMRASEFTAEMSKQKLREVSDLVKNLVTNAFRSPAIETALKVGESFSGPLGDVYDVVRPQHVVVRRQETMYRGPVATVFNGLSLSAADIFAAAQLDQNRSLVVGTSDNIGAAGATRIQYSWMPPAVPDLLSPLPGGVDFGTALARYYRTGGKSGAILENFGIEPHIRYYPTFNDTIYNDRDLFEILGKQLASRRSG